MHRPWLFRRDGIHLTEKGRILIADRISELSNQLLAKSFLGQR